MISRKELDERSNAVMFMFKGIAKSCKDCYNPNTKKVEIDVHIQNKEKRSIYILIEMDHGENIDISFNIDCPEEDFLIAKKYIKNIPKNVFEKRGWPVEACEFYIRVAGGKIYWSIDVHDKFISSRNQDRLANLFKDILEVVGEYLYIPYYGQVS